MILTDNPIKNDEIKLLNKADTDDPQSVMWDLYTMFTSSPLYVNKEDKFKNYNRTYFQADDTDFECDMRNASNVAPLSKQIKKNADLVGMTTPDKALINLAGYAKEQEGKMWSNPWISYDNTTGKITPATVNMVKHAIKSVFKHTFIAHNFKMLATENICLQLFKQQKQTKGFYKYQLDQMLTILSELVDRVNDSVADIPEYVQNAIDYKLHSKKEMQAVINNSHFTSQKNLNKSINILCNAFDKVTNNYYIRVNETVKND